MSQGTGQSLRQRTVPRARLEFRNVALAEFLNWGQYRQQDAPGANAPKPLLKVSNMLEYAPLSEARLDLWVQGGADMGEGDSDPCSAPGIQYD